MLPSKFFNDSATLIKIGDTIRYDGNCNSIELIGDWPSVQCQMVLEITAKSGHSDCTGSIKINDETLQFTASGQTKTTAAFLSAEPSITVANLDCDLMITLIDSAGNELKTETSKTIAVDWDEISVTWYQSAGKWLMSKPNFETPDLTVGIDDKIVHNEKTYTVKNTSQADQTLGGRVLNMFVQL
jgi:hypothetical protein